MGEKVPCEVCVITTSGQPYCHRIYIYMEYEFENTDCGGWGWTGK